MIYRTEYMQRLKAFKDNKIIKVVTGLRRSGKSTLLEMFREELLQSGVQPEQIQYINFDLMKYDAVRHYKQLYDLVTEKALPNKKNYLFFDEIQQVSGWETSFFCTSGIVFFLIALSVVESSPVPRTGDRASGLREASLL